MDRVILKSLTTDDQTQRITSALASRDAQLIPLTHDHPALLATDILKLRRRLKSVKIIHAFGGSALAVAIGAFNGPILFTPSRPPSTALIAWCRAVASCRDLNIICTSDSSRRAIVTRGFDIKYTHLIRPGVNLATLQTTRHRTMRLEMGFADSDTVVFCPLEMTHHSGHDAAVWALSILNVIKPQYKLLLWGRGKLTDSIRELITRTIKPSMVHVADTNDVARLYAACDLVLFTPDGLIPPMSVAMAMASSKPIVSSITPQICEMIEDRHTALLVGSRTPRAIAHRILDLMNDPTLAWKLKDRARAEVYDHYTQAKMLENYRQVYDQVAGSQNVTISPSLTKPNVA